MLYTKNMIVNCRFQNTLKNAVPSGTELVSKDTTNFAVKDNKMTAVFTGSNSIKVPANAINNKLTNGISIFSWIYPANLTGIQYQHIFRKVDIENRMLFAFQEYGTQITVGLNIDGTYFETDLAINITDYNNQWVHVGFTYDKATGILKQYRNGVVINNLAKSTTWAYEGSADGYIGGNAGTLSHVGTLSHFEGNIYDFQMFNGALSAENIKRVMMGLQPF